METFRVLSTSRTASFNVPQTFAVRQLSKCHAEVLVEASEILHLEVAIVPVDAFVKNMER